jgi:methionyl-tRNA formyltransferase
MVKNVYVIATIRPWNIDIYQRVIANYPGTWHLVTKPEELTSEFLKQVNPRYVFFPHWSHIVPDDILSSADCVCFHMTDLPFGRGGSPLQNLIAAGHKETMISALKMTSRVDAGPIYLKRPLSLEGLAEEIFIRASESISEMILEIVNHEPMPAEQQGNPTFFKRRTPEQSEIGEDIVSLDKLFDHIRMLDAEGYPRAFIQHGRFRLEISRPALRTNAIEATVRITDSFEKDIQ